MLAHEGDARLGGEDRALARRSVWPSPRTIARSARGSAGCCCRMFELGAASAAREAATCESRSEGAAL